MSLSKEQNSAINYCLTIACEDENVDKLSGWENNFLFGDGQPSEFKTIEEMYCDEGANMRISDKQYSIIERILEKLEKSNE